MNEYRSFEERFDWLLAFMALDDPFTHELLTILRRKETHDLPTMGVMVEGSALTLYYNREFFNALSDEEVRYVLAHEMFHLALHHCTTRRPTDLEQLKRHNIAADLAVNSLIVEDGWKRMPKGELKGMLPQDFKFPPKLSLEQYFGMLPKQKGGGKGGCPKGGGDCTKSTGGGCPKGDGNCPKDSGHGGFDSHDGWSKEENQIAEEIIRQKIREMENSDRFWGSMPGDIKQIILAAQKSRIAWHRILRYRLGQLASKVSVHTFKRPNRRFGWPYTGFKRDAIDRTLLLWDTSGSIADEELSQFLSETNRIAESHPVDVQMFDHELQGKVTPFSRKMKKVEVKGRGGTSFKEPFELADKMRYGAVVCLTDGCAPAIDKPKHVRDIIWAVVGSQNKPPVTWGRVINIDTVHGRPEVAIPSADGQDA